LPELDLCFILRERKRNIPERKAVLRDWQYAGRFRASTNSMAFAKTVA
jgi:hypothetical protein